MGEAIAVGLLVPSNNTTMEGELAGWLPPASSVVLRRIPRGAGTLTLDDLPTYRANAIRLAEELAEEQIDVVVYGCTAAGLLAGPSGEQELAGALAEATGMPVVTTARSMVLALADTGAVRIAVVTPYAPRVNQQLIAFLEDARMSVTNLRSFEAASTDELAAITPEMVTGLCLETISPSDEALFIACSQLPTFSILDGLQRKLDRPVLSSISATAWNVRREFSEPRLSH